MPPPASPGTLSARCSILRHLLPACRYARRCFDDAVLVGIFSAKGKRPHLNPGEGAMVQEGDRLIVLSNNSVPPPLPFICCLCAWGSCRAKQLQCVSTLISSTISHLHAGLVKSCM